MITGFQQSFALFTIGWFNFWRCLELHHRGPRANLPGCFPPATSSKGHHGPMTHNACNSCSACQLQVGVGPATQGFGRNISLSEFFRWQTRSQFRWWWNRIATSLRTKYGNHEYYSQQTAKAIEMRTKSTKILRSNLLFVRPALYDFWASVGVTAEMEINIPVSWSSVRECQGRGLDPLSANPAVSKRIALVNNGADPLYDGSRLQGLLLPHDSWGSSKIGRSTFVSANLLLCTGVIPQIPENPHRGLPSYPYPLETAQSIKREKEIPEARDAPRWCTVSSFVGYLAKMTCTSIQFECNLIPDRSLAYTWDIAGYEGLNMYQRIHY